MAAKNPKSILLVCLMVFAFALGCKFGGSGQSCTGVLTYEGQTFEGRADNEKQAKLNACNKYCLEADPEFDARYRIWLDSPKGQKAGRPSKKESIYKDKDLLDFVTITCANKCVDNAGKGKTKLEVNCK